MRDGIEVIRAALAPHYNVESEIGAGGMARVYLASERHPPRKVAVKVMRPGVNTTAFRERFVREIELTSQLHHPHIVPVLAAEECLFVPDGPEGLCFYVMPYIEGESLRGRLLRERRLPLEDALRIVREIGGALAYAHARQIIHRDLKPENILLSGDHAYLADFGIARALSGTGERGHLTLPGELVGSLTYMSPEQLSGDLPLDPRTDVYALACVLCEMLLGAPPLLRVTESGPGRRASMLRALRERGVNRAVAHELNGALGRALAAEPDERSASVEELLLRLSEARQPSLSRRLAALFAR